MEHQRFRADLDQLRDVVRRLDAAQAGLEELAQRLERRLGVLHQHWDGTAARTHVDAHARWDSGFAVMRRPGGPAIGRRHRLRQLRARRRHQPHVVAPALMILEIEPLGYADAAGALLTGNRSAAGQHDALVGRLDGLAGMAGDDVTAADFAAAYDAAATEAVAGLADVTAAFMTLGRLTEASLTNHRRAEIGSTLTPGAIVHDVDVELPATSYLTVLPASPPSFLGGDSPALTAQQAWVLDHIEGIVIGVALGAITAGIGAAGGAVAIATRVAAFSPRFAALLIALRTLTSVTAASVRLTHHAIRARRRRLERFLGVPTRTQAGQFTPGRARWRPGWLARHEHSGSHTLSRHVGKGEDELRGRIHSGGTPRASSFATQEVAEKTIEAVVHRHPDQVTRWLASGRDRLTVDDVLPWETGISVGRDAGAAAVRDVRLILVRDAGMPDGYRVLTAFPKP